MIQTIFNVVCHYIAINSDLHTVVTQSTTVQSVGFNTLVRTQQNVLSRTCGSVIAYSLIRLRIRCEKRKMSINDGLQNFNLKLSFKILLLVQARLQETVYLHFDKVGL